MLPDTRLTDQSIADRTQPHTHVRAAAVQLTATADKATNLETADRLVRAAARDGASLVVLPEKWSVYGSLEDQRAGAEPLDGPALSWARSIARELEIDLVAGSIAEAPGARTGVAPDERGRGSNTSVHVGPDGADRATYRKLHMFDVLVGGRDYRESDGEAPGDEIVLSALADGTGLGLTICYDLRFPELYRRLAVDGARVLVVPSAFTEPTTRDHWEILLRARAIENQAFVVAANQVGRHAPGLKTGGRSMIVDPWGIVLAQAADTETHIVAELDLDRLERLRADLPSLANRRPEVYG
jgi:predicted amidohydrolase